MRTFLFITAFFLIILIGGISLKGYKADPTTTSTEVPLTQTTEIQEAAQVTPTETPSKQVTTLTQTTIQTPQKQTEAIVTTNTSHCVKGGTCTQEEVAQHNTRTDCYVSMSNLGKVYDVTSYVKNDPSMHPGGDISDYCGVDIFTTFTGQTGDHQHSGRAMQDLSSFEFATLQ